MLIGDVRPTTLDGVKSLAAQLRREQGIKYSNALDLAAKLASCSNFRNAQRILPARGTALAHPYVLMTTYWMENKKRYLVGRETLRVELSKPILDICGKSKLKYVRGFGNLRMVADDHFVCDTVAHNQSYARNCLLTAERSLRFMEHTGLCPSRDYRKAYPKGAINDKLPGMDHSTDWVDPATGQFILVDEPYGGAPNEDERAVWAARTGWRVIKTSWPGMYNPYQCDLYVATDGDADYDLDALVTKIEAMPAPVLEDGWLGESSPSWDTFSSPKAKTPQDLRRARCRGTIYPTASATSVPYSYRLGSSMRRPVGKLEIDGHIEAGRIIKAVLRSHPRSYGVYRRMNSLRSTLEDWLNLEISRDQLQGPEFFDVYYHELEDGDPFTQLVASPDGAISLLKRLRQNLQSAYTDCAPLRRQLRRIDMSVSLIGKVTPVLD